MGPLGRADSVGSHLHNRLVCPLTHKGLHGAKPAGGVGVGEVVARVP